MKNKFKPQRFRIFQNNNQIIISVEKDRFGIDIEELLSIINNFTKGEKESLNDYDISVIFMGILLTGGIESTKPYHECFFGTLDSNNSMGLDDTKPIYHFIPKDSSDFIESKQNMQRDSAYKQDSTFAESSSDSNKLNADSTQTAESQKDSTTSKQTDSANDSIISPQSPQQDSKLLGTLKYI